MKQKKVCCPPTDQDATYSHPRVYSKVDPEHNWICPYCGEEYRY